MRVCNIFKCQLVACQDRLLEEGALGVRGGQDLLCVGVFLEELSDFSFGRKLDGVLGRRAKCYGCHAYSGLRLFSGVAWESAWVSGDAWAA